MSTTGEDPPTTSPPPTPSTSEPPSSSSQPPSSSSNPSSSQPSSSTPGQTSSQPPPPGDTTTPPSSTESSTSTIYVTTTDSSGVVYTTIPGASPSHLGNGGSQDQTNIGAIVGGVIGGIAAIFLLAILIFLCRRRNRSKAQFEDGIFDPDHTIQRPVSQAVNPAFENASDMTPGAARVTPYAYMPDPDNPAYDHGPEMRQSGYEDSVAPSSGAPSDYPLFSSQHAGGYNPHAHGHGGGIPAALLAGPAAAGVARSHTTATNSSGYPPSPYGGASYGPLSVSDYDRSSHAPSSPTRTAYSVPPSSNSAGAPPGAVAAAAPLNPRSAKEREAFANSHARPYNGGGGSGGSHPGLSVANPGPGSPTEEHRTGTPIVVHQDGGRVPAPRDDEIPPTYDSIPTNR